MIIENLEQDQLIRIANIYSIDNWRMYYSDKSSLWSGFDLVGDNYIFQLSYEGTIRIICSESLCEMNVDYEQEDKMRKVLNDILRKT